MCKLTFYKGHILKWILLSSSSHGIWDWEQTMVEW